MHIWVLLQVHMNDNALRLIRNHQSIWHRLKTSQFRWKYVDIRRKADLEGPDVVDPSAKKTLLSDKTIAHWNEVFKIGVVQEMLARQDGKKIGGVGMEVEITPRCTCLPPRQHCAEVALGAQINFYSTIWTLIIGQFHNPCKSPNRVRCESKCTVAFLFPTSEALETIAADVL